VPQYGL